MAAKVGHLDAQRTYYEEVFKPTLARAGSTVEYLGELAPPDRDRLFAESYATIMPGAWPEPFGLVAIESLACGTPIVARRVGGLPESSARISTGSSATTRLRWPSAASDLGRSIGPGSARGSSSSSRRSA
jgi:hypothetical protein